MLQISDGILRDNSKFPTKKITSVQNSNSALKFFLNKGFHPQILQFWTKIFQQSFPTIFQQPKI